MHPSEVHEPSYPSDVSPRRGWAELVSMACLIGAVCGLLFVDMGWEQPQAWSWAVLGWLGMGLTVWWWWRDRISMPVVLAGAVVLRLIVLPFPPLLSDDFYRYLWDGLVQHAGDNPYRYLPSDDRFAAFHDMVEYQKSNSQDYHSVYPPVSQMAFYLAAAFRGWGFQVAYMAMKCQWLVLELAGIWALSRMVRARDVMLYAWNPLVVVALVGQGHTETGMVGAMLLAIYALRHQRAGWASVALAVAGWIKLYPFLLFPFLLNRYGWKKIWPGVTVAAAIGIGYFDLETLGNLNRSLDLYLSYFSFNAGPYFVLREWSWTLGLGDLRPLISAALMAVFGVVGLLTWWGHRREKITFETAVFLVFGAYLACSRTLHPWYLAGVLAVLPWMRPAWRWPWLWLGAGAWGTYLFYVDGTYWPFVWIGWCGWTLGLLWACGTSFTGRRAFEAGVQRALRWRARAKAEVIRPTLTALSERAPGRPLELLDCGGAEGYLAERLVQISDVRAEVVDVCDRCRVDLPATVYDGDVLPYRDDRFDVVVSYFVLHHAENPEQTLHELCRVASKRVIIVESWGRTPWRRKWLRRADLAANWLRGGQWSDPIAYHSLDEWSAMAEAAGWRVVGRRDLGGWFHAKLYLEFAPDDAS